MGDSRRVEFKILEGNDGNAFQIDELGTLKTNKELDAESQPSYSLKVQASMSGNRKAIGFVTIRVVSMLIMLSVSYWLAFSLTIQFVAQYQRQCSFVSTRLTS